MLVECKMSNFLTKIELANIWKQYEGSKYENEHGYICPYCRDELADYEGKLFCTNPMCKNDVAYKADREIEVIGKRKELIPDYMCNLDH